MSGGRSKLFAWALSGGLGLSLLSGCSFVTLEEGQRMQEQINQLQQRSTKQGQELSDKLQQQSEPAGPRSAESVFGVPAANQLKAEAFEEQLHVFRSVGAEEPSVGVTMVCLNIGSIAGQ